VGDLKGKKVRVLVVDDSAFYRQSMTSMLSSAPQVEIIGTARDGADAIMLVTKHRPDVITLDLEMPNVNGFVFLRWLMENTPTPVIVVSSQSDQASVFKALELGAVDFLAKPTPRASWRIMEIRDELIAKVRAVAFVPIDRLISKAVSTHGPSVSFKMSDLKVVNRADTIQLVAIGASTGGPTAVQSIIGGLPEDFPVPVVVTQHMPPGFTQYFAERLDKLSQVTVREAHHGDWMESGTVYICPGGFHMTFKHAEQGILIQLHEKQESDRYVPSVDRMFSSATEVYGGQVLGVILTGMGNDGRIGMRKIKEAGGQTLAESEETAVVFGMPKEAIAEGVVDQILPLPQIPAEIVKRIWFQPGGG